MFPVRIARFSGYKLDMSIINELHSDSHVLALIKSLVYYCQLTQSCCIAEGVDSIEKFNLLKALGVNSFQDICSPRQLTVNSYMGFSRVLIYKHYRRNAYSDDSGQ